MNEPERPENAHEEETVILWEGGHNLVDPAALLRWSEMLERALAAGKQRTVVLDLQQIQFIGSDGLNRLIVAETRAKRAGGRLRLSNLRETVREIFTLTRLDRTFDIL